MLNIPASFPRLPYSPRRKSCPKAVVKPATSTEESGHHKRPHGHGAGIGGTPEGIIAAAAIRCMGGAIQAKLAPRDEAERRKALDAGYDLGQVLTTADLVSGDNVFFCATGVTEGDLLKGVRYYPGGCTTQSIVMRSKSGTVRLIEAYHRLSKLNEYSAIDFTGDSSAAYPLP